MRMPRIAMEPAGVVIDRVRCMSLARNVGPRTPAVNFMTQFASGRRGSPRRRMRPSGGEMKDLTKGPVAGHILQLSLFIAMSTTFQTLYFLADLYFVGKLGKEAIAGVALGGNLMMLVLALTQSLGVD